MQTNIKFNPYRIRYELEVYTNGKLQSKSNHPTREETEFYFVTNYVNNAVATYSDYRVDYHNDMESIQSISVIPSLEECNTLFNTNTKG